jgi:regulator of ribonuclease activity B
MDAATIVQLANSGAELRSPRETDYFLYFFTEEAARSAAERSLAAGSHEDFCVQCRAPMPQRGW